MRYLLLFLQHTDCTAAYHHIHSSCWHDWLQTFDIAHGAVELFCVSLFKALNIVQSNIQESLKCQLALQWKLVQQANEVAQCEII